MNDEIKAQRLAAWLSSPAGTDPPEDLDPEVLGAVWALVPDRAPTARVSLDDILGAVTTGPFASEAPGVEAPTTGTVVEFPIDEARPPVRLVAHAGGRGERDDAPVVPVSEPVVARRRPPSQAWMLPAIGLTLAAAAATLLVMPQMGKLDRPDLAEQEAWRDQMVAAPPAPSASMAPSSSEAKPAAGEGPADVPAPSAIAEMAAPPAGEPALERHEAEARLAARGRGTDEADQEGPGGWGPPAVKDVEMGGLSDRGDGGGGGGIASGSLGGVGTGEGYGTGSGSAADKGEAARTQAPASPAKAASAPSSASGTSSMSRTPMPSAAPTSSQASSPPPAPAARPAEIAEATSAPHPGAGASWAPSAADEAPVAQPTPANTSAPRGRARDTKRDDRGFLPEAGPAVEREAVDDSMADGDAYGAEEEQGAKATQAVAEKKERSASASKPKAPSRTDAGNVATRSARAAAAPLDYDPDWYRPFSDVAASFDAARADEAAGRWEEAAVKWRVLTADGRVNVAQDAALRCGKALRALGRAGDALAVVDSGLRRSGANTTFRASLLAQRGDLLAALGRNTEAEVAWAEAAALNASR